MMIRDRTHTFGYWFLAVFLGVSILLMLLGQTMAVLDYELAVRLGLQESLEEVGPFGVQMNRAFGASDTVVYVPLMLASLLGLLRRRRWSLVTTAAVAGISLYWSMTIVFVLVFARTVPGYSLRPGPEYAVFLGAYVVFGIWCIGYLVTRGDAILGVERSEGLGR